MSWKAKFTYRVMFMVIVDNILQTWAYSKSNWLITNSLQQAHNTCGFQSGYRSTMYHEKPLRL